MTYQFDAVRWCKARARSARAQRNSADENSFIQVAREIEELRARLAEVEEQRDGLKAVLIFIDEECDWEEPKGDFGGGGDRRIGPAIREALAKLEVHDG